MTYKKKISIYFQEFNNSLNTPRSFLRIERGKLVIRRSCEFIGKDLDKKEKRDKKRNKELGKVGRL